MIAPIRPIDDRGGVDFLGPEWLTWLWFRCAENPCFQHDDGTEVFLHFDEHLEFRGERSAARRTTLRAGMPSASLEARAALQSGKTLVAARLLLARGEDEVHFTLRAEDMDISSLKLPAPEGDTPEDRQNALLDLTEQFLDDLDLCLRRFLELRLSDAWNAEVERIQAFAAAKAPEAGVPAGA